MANEINDAILSEAKKMIGTWEWAGDEHNPKVIAMYADAGHPEIRRDEVPWCAAFVGSILSKVGLRNTGSLLAKSYLSWGEKVASLREAIPGDIVVFNRGSQSWQGHVGFLVGYNGTSVSVLGGNQNDQVNISKYPVSSLAGIRRAKQPRETVVESTTVGATTVGATGAIAAGGTAISQLEGDAQIVAIVGLVVVLLAFAWIFRERIKKWHEGIR